METPPAANHLPREVLVLYSRSDNQSNPSHQKHCAFLRCAGESEAVAAPSTPPSQRHDGMGSIPYPHQEH